MRISRALIVTLALMVSPVAASVCEVVCGAAPHSAHQTEAAPAATVDEHAHHGHHPAPVPEEVTVSVSSPGGVTLSIPAPACDLRGAAPARLRTTFNDHIGSSAEVTTSAYLLEHAPARQLRPAGATSSPPAPPPLAPLPLRI